MLWDPSDHSCNNRNKRMDMLLQQVAKKRPKTHLHKVVFGQVSEAIYIKNNF